ncbi:MAG: SnoaL-like domain-containing protein [Oceanicaulis sp.]
MFNQALREVANALVEANRTDEIEPLLERRYDQGCVSVEAAAMGDMPREAHGLDAIRAKHDWWTAHMEMHGGEVEGPFLFEPDRFAVRFTMDATDRNTGQRTQGAEIAVYTVKDGKIVREEFFYDS